MWIVFSKVFKVFYHTFVGKVEFSDFLSFLELFTLMALMLELLLYVARAMFSHNATGLAARVSYD